METRLQSSEVRIPKVEPSSGGGFEFSTLAPCPYFQSSFARSLSFNTNQSQSLDFELSFRIGGKSCTNGMLETCDSSAISNIDEDDNGTPPPPLPVTAPPLLGNGPQSLPQHIGDCQLMGSTPKRRFNTNNLSRSHQVSVWLWTSWVFFKSNRLSFHMKRSDISVIYKFNRHSSSVIHSRQSNMHYKYIVKPRTTEVLC